MNDPVLTGAAVVFLLIFIFVIVRYAMAPRYPYVSRRLLSHAELKFYRQLAPLIPPNLCLSLKPRLGDLIDVDELVRQKDAQWKGRYGAPVWSKHIDFVVFDPADSEIVLCIELDDASHLTKDARRRDGFKDKALAAADIPLLRIKTRAFYDQKFLTGQLAPYFD